MHPLSTPHSLLPSPLRKAAVRRALAGVATSTAMLACAASASAATASLSGTTLTITDQPGHAARITIGQLDNPLNLPLLSNFVISSNSSITPVPSGCVNALLGLTGDPNTLLCNRSAIQSLKLELGDGNDTVSRPLALTLLGAQALPLGTLPVQINGGDGDDDLSGGDGNDTIDGGAGADHIAGFGGNDTIVGGTGNDTIEPGTGTNTIDTSSPEVDTVTVTPGSTNDATASANDVFLGTGATTTISILGLDVSIAGNGNTTPDTSGDAGSSGSGIGATISVSAGLPSVDDLLGGAAKAIAGGSVPKGVVLPIQPVIDSLGSIAGSVKVGIGGLPAGVALDRSGLHISVKCSVNCSTIASGVIDLGGGDVIKLDPGVSKVNSSGSGKLNLGLHPFDYVKLQKTLNQGKCVVAVSRLRVHTEEGDEVISYALPVCGAKIDIEMAGRPVVDAKRVTRRVSAAITCSKECDAAPRFLLVKSGNTVLARLTTAKVWKARGSKRIHSSIWKLSKAQARRIERGHRAGFNNIRYVVSAVANAGGVQTTGTASFRTRRK